MMALVTAVRVRLFNAAFYVSMAVVAYVMLFTVGRSVETAMFPVFSYFRIASVQEIEPNVIRLQVSFTKDRDCEPGGYAWYAGQRGGTFRELGVRTIPPEGNQTGIRPLGAGQVSRPFDLLISADEFEAGIFADVYSRCHPLWLSRSEVYPDPRRSRPVRVKRLTTS